MSVRGVLLAGAAVAALALPGTAEAQSFGAPIQDLNMRAGPGTGYGIVAVMPAGVSVTIHQCTGGWCQLTYAGFTGWASQRYLDMQVAYAPDGAWVAGREPVWGGSPSVGVDVYAGAPYYYDYDDDFDWYAWRRPAWYSGWHHPGWWHRRPMGWYGPVYWDHSRWWHGGRWHHSPGFAFHIGLG